MYGRMAAVLSLAFASSLAGATPEFAHDVWPVLEKHCVGCHQPGAIGPMSLTSYSEIRPWSRAIRQAVLSKSMPPWHAAPGTAHAFRNDRSL